MTQSLTINTESWQSHYTQWRRHDLRLSTHKVDSLITHTGDDTISDYQHTKWTVSLHTLETTRSLTINTQRLSTHRVDSLITRTGDDMISDCQHTKWTVSLHTLETTRSPTINTQSGQSHYTTFMIRPRSAHQQCLDPPLTAGMSEIHSEMMTTNSCIFALFLSDIGKYCLCAWSPVHWVLFRVRK